MNYAEMLNDIISESGLSLRQITKRCAELNVSITPSYISQLKNGKLAPPATEVSMVIAEACGSKMRAELVFQGYMEKAPTLVKEYMLASSSLNKELLSALCKANCQDFTGEMHEYLQSMDVLAALDLSSVFVHSGEEGVNELVKRIMMSAGLATQADAKGELIQLFLSDASMQPLIPIHASIYIIPTRQDLLKDRDIVAFYPDNRKSAVLRRIYFMKDNILLLPEDMNHNIYVLENLSAVNYIGKVVSYKVDL